MIPKREMEITETAPEDGSKPQANGNVASNGADKKKSGWFRSLLNKNEETSLKTELEEIIQEHEDSSTAPASDNAILRNVLKFDELKVVDVMTPRLDICAIPADITLDDLKKYIDEKEHTRIPVYDKNLDDVVGFIHIKDLITYWIEPKKFKIHEILREILYVPPSMKINNLLVKMQNERTHMAVVVDEYGGTSGLVTIEDLVEEIVGEIEDEHDEEDQEEFLQVDENTYEVLARIEIKKLEENLSVNLDLEGHEKDYDTLGGLIFAILNKIPRIGENISHANLNFKIIDADKRRIKRIKIVRAAIINPEI